jgi:hypothetical protein
MGEYLETIKILWEKAARDEAGKREISQFDQIIDFLVTDKGQPVERFQIETERGGLRFHPAPELKQQPLDRMFVVDIAREGFDRLFSLKETFIDQWYENRIRCLPTMKKDYLIGWVGRIFELAKKIE